jgi:hypothetical protein
METYGNGSFPAIPAMKKPVFIFLLLAAACGPAAEAAVTPPPAAASAAPVYVPAMCTLMGRSPRTKVSAGHPVILMWGWSAATEDQMQDYLRAAVATVTLDGTEIQGRRQGEMPYDEAAGVFRAIWTSEVGILKIGLHTVIYRLTFREVIFDGFAYYGPGTKNETQEDRCEIEVS